MSQQQSKRQGRFNEGDRVRLRHPVDRYPHFLAAGGLSGVVVDVSDDQVSLIVRMDEPLPGAEEWDNEIHWFDGLDPAGDLEILHGGECDECGAEVGDVLVSELHEAGCSLHPDNVAPTAGASDPGAASEDLLGAIAAGAPTAGASVPRKLVATFDVTGLTERQVDNLGMYVQVQAEESNDDDDEDAQYSSVPVEITVEPPFPPELDANSSGGIR